MKKVLICDDHVLLRRGLVDFIHTIPNFRVVGEASTGAEILSLYQSQRPDIVVLDISLPQSNGFEVFAQIRKIDPSAKVLFLTMHLELPFFEKAKEMGVDGYITKDKAPELLEKALSMILEGERFFDLNLLNLRIEHSIDHLPEQILQNLSDREKQVLSAILGGKSLTSLAQELELSVKTVSSHRNRLLEKLNLKSNADLIRWVITFPALPFTYCA